MKVKTSKLTGAALDWAVGKIDQPCWTEEDLLANLQEDDDGYFYSPSLNWQQGGQIIERERIDVFSIRNGNGWCAQSDVHVYNGYGPTPLIAAMRCYVFSRLGDEVDIPEELK